MGNMLDETEERGAWLRRWPVKREDESVEKRECDEKACD